MHWIVFVTLGCGSGEDTGDAVDAKYFRENAEPPECFVMGECDGHGIRGCYGCCNSSCDPADALVCQDWCDNWINIASEALHYAAEGVGGVH